jgi:zinc D-Ala-D-Ala dipeptidase
LIRWDRTQGRPEPIRLLNRVKEEECGEPLVDITTIVTRINLTRSSVIPHLRHSVAVKLAQAAENLPEGLQFGVIDCWRPLARQQRIYDFMYRSAKEVYPGRSHSSLRRTVCRWVAPTDQKAPPGHCTGAAIDLQLEDLQGNVIDIWSPYERYEAAPTHMLGLTPEAKEGRNLLLKLMTDAGFSNCRDEWWHYSYGDAGWAVRCGSNTCIYGLANLDLPMVAESERLHEEAIRKRSNPFHHFPKS